MGNVQVANHEKQVGSLVRLKHQYEIGRQKSERQLTPIAMKQENRTTKQFNNGFKKNLSSTRQTSEALTNVNHRNLHNFPEMRSGCNDPMHPVHNKF